jgi:hypothetical protein
MKDLDEYLSQAMEDVEMMGNQIVAGEGLTMVTCE